MGSEAQSVCVDTSFLIDVQRELRRSRRSRPAHRWLSQHLGVELALSSVAMGEFAEGFDDTDHPIVQAIARSHRLLPVDHGVALAYSRIARTMRLQGQLIGANDLWIAATALHHRLPLLTANEKDFARVPGLVVRCYRPSSTMDHR